MNTEQTCQEFSRRCREPETAALMPILIMAVRRLRHVEQREIDFDAMPPASLRRCDLPESQQRRCLTAQEHKQYLGW